MRQRQRPVAYLRFLERQGPVGPQHEQEMRLVRKVLSDARGDIKKVRQRVLFAPRKAHDDGLRVFPVEDDAEDRLGVPPLVRDEHGLR